MASSFLVAKRYSKALLSVCVGVEGARNAQTALGDLVSALRSSKDLTELLSSPAFSSDEKWKVVQALAEKVSAPEQLVKFLKVLTLNDRAEVLPELEEIFKSQVLEMNASVEAEVETAASLSDAHVSQIASMLTKVVGKKVKVVQIIRPELIAGIRVNVLGKTLDASLASNLELVHRELLVAQA